MKKTLYILCVSLICSAISACAPLRVNSQAVGLFDIFERSVTNTNSYSNRFDFNEVEIQTMFISPSGRIINFFGFYDGDGNGGQNGNVWKFRFMPDETGNWTYTYCWKVGSSPCSPAGSGSFSVIDSGLAGPLKIASDNSRFFATARGEPFNARAYGMHQYLSWTASGRMTQEVENFKSVLRTHVADRGYNLIMWPDMSNRLRREATGADGAEWRAPNRVLDTWWLHPDMTADPIEDTKRFNVATWRAAENALNFCKSQGIYAINFAAFFYQRSEYEFNDFKVFLRYFVARFGAYYNFFGWSPTWEWMDVLTPSEMSQIMQYVHDIDPFKRLLTAHDNSYSTFDSWLSFSMRQATARDVFQGNSRRSGQQQIFDPNGSGGVGDPFIDKPIIGSEDVWEMSTADSFGPAYSVPRNGAESRRAAWGIQMASVIPLYDEWNAWRPEGGGTGQGEPDIRRMFAFFHSMTAYRQYQQLNSLVSSSAGQIASGIAGQEYLVYDQNGGNITIDMTGAFGTFDVLWYDPKNGTEYRVASVQGGGSLTLSPPAGLMDDSVVLMKAAALADHGR